MYKSQEFYKMMSDAQLEQSLLNFIIHKEYYKHLLEVDIKEDIDFLIKEIKTRQFVIISNQGKFPKIVEELENLDASNELKELLIPCKTNSEALEVLRFINNCHNNDPLWEEDWLESEGCLIEN